MLQGCTLISLVVELLSIELLFSCVDSVDVDFVVVCVDSEKRNTVYSVFCLCGDCIVLGDTLL